MQLLKRKHDLRRLCIRATGRRSSALIFHHGLPRESILALQASRRSSTSASTLLYDGALKQGNPDGSLDITHRRTNSGTLSIQPTPLPPCHSK